HQDVSEGTKRNRKRTLRYFEAHATGRGFNTVDEIDLETLTSFRSTRPINALSWIKELEMLRHFFRYCFDNDWIVRNWAQKVPMPKNIKPSEREPYEPKEIVRIIAACDGIGRGPYERLRARAMTLLLRYTALRISDVALLQKNRITD